MGAEQTSTAVVIGHRGQDGSLLTERLRSDGIRVIGVGRPGSPTDGEGPTVDVADPGTLDAMLDVVQPDEIYYLAAHHGSSETLSAAGTAADVTAAWAVNVAGPANLLEAVRRTGSGARILLASTCLVHGPSADRIDERTPLAPDTVYGATKAAAMLLAREHRREGLPVWTAVLFPHESGRRHPTFVTSRIVRGALAVRAGASNAVTVGDPSAVVDWSLASAVTDGLVRMLRRTPPADYVLASGEGRTVGELAAAVLIALDLDPERHLRTDPGLLARPPARRVGDPARFHALTGWTGRPDLAEFARILIDEHRAVLAEGGGFEPPRAVKPNTDSSRAP